MNAHALYERKRECWTCNGQLEPCHKGKESAWRSELPTEEVSGSRRTASEVNTSTCRCVGGVGSGRRAVPAVRSSIDAVSWQRNSSVEVGVSVPVGRPLCCWWDVDFLDDDGRLAVEPPLGLGTEVIASSDVRPSWLCQDLPPRRPLNTRPISPLPV
jgi:hypothetical protein